MTFNVSIKMVNELCISDGVYTLFKKKFLLFDRALLKCFVYSRVGILDYPWCNNPCCAHQELGQGDFYSFDQKFIYYLSTKNVTARKTILTSILSFVTEWTSIGLQNFWLPLSVIVSSKLSTIKDYFEILTFFIDEH